MRTANFQASEFLCKCGCGLGVKDELILTLQRVRDDWDRPMVVDCGARCPEHNASPEVRGAPDSAHISGEAADIADVDGKLKAWMTEDRLRRYGLWAEDYRYTSDWIHLQIRPAHARIFRP